MHLYRLPFKQAFYFNRHLKIFGETTLGEQEGYRFFISNFTKAFFFIPTRIKQGMSSVFQYVFPASENYASIHSRLVMWLTWFIVYHSLFKRGRALNKETKLHQYKWPVPVRWSAEIIYYFLTCCSIYTALCEKRNSAPQDIQLINKTTAEAVCSHITSKSRGLLRMFSQRLDFESEGFPQDQGNPQGSLGSTGGPQQLLRALWHPTAGSSPFHCTLPSRSWGITKAHRLAPQQKELGGLEENIWTNDSGQVLCFCHFWSFFFSLNHFYSRKEKHALAHTAELSLPAALGRRSCWFSERRNEPERGITSHHLAAARVASRSAHAPDIVHSVTSSPPEVASSLQSRNGRTCWGQDFCMPADQQQGTPSKRKHAENVLCDPFT